jgi:type 1 glutamine amidotransferase
MPRSHASSGRCAPEPAASRTSRIAVACCALFVAAACADGNAGPVRPRVLAFSRTTGYRHATIPNAIAALREAGPGAGFDVDATEDASVFNDTNLARYRAVVFLLTTGDVLDAGQQAAFERYFRGGGAYAGIHSASDTEYDWPFYASVVGAYFKDHPPIQAGAIERVDATHPASSVVAARWPWTDEWYNFRSNPRGAVRVLLRADESTYSGGSMGADHPIAWCRVVEGGRAFYTALGHVESAWSDAVFRAHVAGGIAWAAKLREADCTPN